MEEGVSVPDSSCSVVVRLAVKIGKLNLIGSIVLLEDLESGLMAALKHQN